MNTDTLFFFFFFVFSLPFAFAWFLIPEIAFQKPSVQRPEGHAVVICA